LGHLHLHDAVYRSISLDRLRLGANGYPQLTDFSLCKDLSGIGGGRTYTVCGTPDYLSPEQVSQTGHGTESDLWAVGILAFELLNGESPWAKARSELEIFEKITAHKSEGELPHKEGTSPDAIQFIADLLEPKEYMRPSGMDEIEESPWFKNTDGFNWDNFYRGAMPAPHQGQCQTWMKELVPCPETDDAFDTQAYFADSRWCQDWDYMCQIGFQVKDTKEAMGTRQHRRMSSIVETVKDQKMSFNRKLSMKD